MALLDCVVFCVCANNADKKRFHSVAGCCVLLGDLGEHRPLENYIMRVGEIGKICFS